MLNCVNHQPSISVVSQTCWGTTCTWTLRRERHKWTSSLTVCWSSVVSRSVGIPIVQSSTDHWVFHLNILPPSHFSPLISDSFCKKVEQSSDKRSTVVGLNMKLFFRDVVWRVITHHCNHGNGVFQMLDTLLTTLIREMQREGPSANRSEAKLVARRFVRSVARIFTVLSLEMAPQSSRKKMWVTYLMRVVMESF